MSDPLLSPSAERLVSLLLVPGQRREALELADYPLTFTSLLNWFERVQSAVSDNVSSTVTEPVGPRLQVLARVSQPISFTPEVSRNLREPLL